MTARRTTRILGAALLSVGLALSLAGTPAGALVNQLKDPGFEKPVVAGAVDFPTGSKIGTCTKGAPYPGNDFHCWRVGSGTARLIHDDYLIGGVPVKPRAGAQFVDLVGSPGSPAGGAVPGEIHQSTKVPSSTTPTLRFAYAAMPVPNTVAAIHIVVNACTVNGATCVNDVDLYLLSASTGNPAKMGWKIFTAPIPVNADMGLVELSVSSTPNPRATGDGAVDAFSLS